eukprot:g58731.t1
MTDKNAKNAIILEVKADTVRFTVFHLWLPSSKRWLGGSVECVFAVGRSRTNHLFLGLQGATRKRLVRYRQDLLDLTQLVRYRRDLTVSEDLWEI